ncbi:MAG: TonB-dependent receptor [Sphingobium sp.]
MKQGYLASTAWLAVWAMGSPALAQTSDDSSNSDIIVTARRVEERLQDVPISITVFSQQQLANRNIVSAGDIAIYTPSLAVNSRFGPEKTSFSIRGFNQDNGTAPSVGVYFADVPALRSVGSTTTGNGAGPGAMFDLQNLQVLKGPQGTLFGRNTSGGAVILVPQKPNGQLGGYVEGSIGNHDLRRVQAVLNVPVTDTLRVRLGVDRQTREGYMTNVSGIGPHDFNDVDYWAVRASVVADLTPNLENYFLANFSESNTSGFLPRLFECNRAQAATNPVVALQCAQVARTNSRDFYTGEGGIIGPGQSVQQFQFINTTTWKASDALTIKNIVSYGEFRESLRSTVYGENLQIVTGPDAGKNALRVYSNAYPGFKSASLSTFTEELQFQGSAFDDRLSWQAGGYMEVGSPLGFAGTISTNTGSCSSTDPFTGCGAFIPAANAARQATSLTSRVNKFGFQDYGIYAQGTYRLNDHFSVTGGARYTWDYYQVTARHINYSPVPPTANPPIGYCADGFSFGARNTPTNPGTLTQAQCETYRRGRSSAPTWLIDLDYKPVDDILLYAKYARGYRQGQIKPEGYGREAFEPEAIDNYELGLKTTWRGAVRGTFNVAAFYNDFSNQQISTSGNFRVAGLTPGQLITNVGKSRIAGVEVDASLIPFTGLTVDVGYAYLDTKVKSLSPPPGDAVFSSFLTSGALLNYPLTYSPKNKVTVTGTYMLPLPPEMGKLSVGATFTHIDKQYSNFQDTPFIAQIGRDLGLLPPLDLLNVNINWNGVAGGPVDLALFATNVTKQRYATATFGGFASFGLESMSVGEPRMYGLRLKYRFGR